ncbi:MAG: hypothetical protein HXS41_10615 [Theionarchaea archaeon]|nr:hypothetical protein [Theionarchaea archaeon]MBU7000719.1 hypothetical protein [Theionarchaea archaeon]MBU7021498.1 hypothetical protein [Theionarchaea archaeon]MBU7033563.1 hypothetical protein [Theionarchaea archaeon]MBU7039629.1 hypothetical protein [Theionarchaea archaeon]
MNMNREAVSLLQVLNVGQLLGGTASLSIVSHSEGGERSVFVHSGLNVTMEEGYA